MGDFELVGYQHLEGRAGGVLRRKAEESFGRRIPQHNAPVLQISDHDCIPQAVEQRAETKLLRQITVGNVGRGDPLLAPKRNAPVGTEGCLRRCAGPRRA